MNFVQINSKRILIFAEKKWQEESIRKFVKENVETIQKLQIILNKKRNKKT